MISHMMPTTMSISEYAAMKLAEAQHAKGVTVRMNPHNYRTEYINPDGSIVPDYTYFLIKANNGEI